MTDYTEEEINVLLKEYPTGGVKQVQKYIKRTPDSIRHKAKSLHITREDGFRLSKKDFSHFFNVKTPEIAYLLGMIWGDGYVSCKSCDKNGTKKGSYAVTFTIQKSDFEDIKNVCSDFLLRKVQIKSYWKELTMASIYSKKLAHFLYENDYTKKSIESPIKILQKIPIEYQHLFFRGWFDADGSNNGLPTKNRSCILAGSYEQKWDSFTNLLDKLNMTYKIRRYINKKTNNKYSVVIFSRYNSIISFRDYLYSSFPEIGLKRKRDNFFNILPPIRLKSLKS